MIDINKEAEEYAKTITSLPKWNEHDASIFIAGANSKYVKKTTTSSSNKYIRNNLF